MPYESLTDTPLIRRLNANDTPSQMALVKKLSALNTQLMQDLAPQPRFGDFVQWRFEQRLSIKPAAQVHSVFVQSRDRQPASLVPAPTTVDETLELKAPLPTLMDAVIQRIVTGQASTFASRDTEFLRASEEGGEPQRIPELTGQAVDEFLEDLATGLDGHYQTFIQRYWDEQRATDARSRWLRVLDGRIAQLRSEVALLKNDGVLSTAGEALFETVVRLPDALSRRTLKAYKPCVYGVALKGKDAVNPLLHGAFILTARDPQDAEVGWETDTQAAPQVRPVDPSSNLGLVLLYSPGNGLEEFDSLSSLDHELHQRLNHPVQFTHLLALMAEKHQPHGLALHREAKTSGQLAYLEWLDSPFSRSLEDQRLKLHEDFTATVALYQAPATQTESARLAESLDRVTDSARALDAQRVLVARIQKRAQAQLKIFLEGATDADKQAWRAAMQSYCDGLKSLPESEGLPSLAQFSDKTAMCAYSKAQLTALIESQWGLQVDPDEIQVHTRAPDVPTVPFVPGAPASSPREPGAPLYTYRQRSLSELALENVGGLDFNFTNFSHLTDKKKQAYTALTVEQVKDLVRTANIGNRYDAFLKDRLITSPEAIARKSNFARYLALQVRMDAIEAKIAGDFLPDHASRGFNWVQVVLDEPVDSDRRQTVEAHRIMVQSLMLRGARVRGVWLFRTASSAVASTVVYTPQAPGGRMFHEFHDERLLNDFVFNSSWRDYLVSRVELAQRKRIRSILRGRGSATMVYMPRIADNLFEEAYEIEASFAINDAGAKSTTTGETDLETAISVGTAAFDLITLVLPIKIMLPIGLARSLFSVFRAVDAATLGDRAETAHHLVRALGEFTGALIDGAVAGLAGVRTSASASGGLNPLMALKKKPGDVQVLDGWEGKGIYYKAAGAEGRRHYFLNEQNRWFSILDEGGEKAWRVKDARKPYRYHHDPIRLDAKGRWEVGSHPDRGLRGGLSPVEALRALYPNLSEGQARLVFESFNFPRGRELELQLSVVHHLRSGTLLDAFYQYLSVTPQRFSVRVRGGEVPGLSLTSVEPVPSTSQARPARPASERIADWGRSIDAGEMLLKDANYGVYQRVGGDPALRGTEYLKIDERYFPILPDGRAATTRAATVLMHDPDIPIGTYDQFETMLRTDLYNQPRAATFARADGRWVNDIDLPFQKTLAAYVGDAWPMLSVSSQADVARSLFNRVNRNGLNVVGVATLQRILRHWRRERTVVEATLGDPLLLLPVTPRSVSGEWPLSRQPGQYTQLTFRTDQVHSLFQDAVTNRSQEALKALMADVLRRNRYQLVPGYDQVGELLFKHPGHATVYWMQVHSAFGHAVGNRASQVAPRASLMSAQTRSAPLVPLIGGIQLSFEGGATLIYVIRI